MSDLNYHWIIDWIKIPNAENHSNGRTHAAAVTKSGNILIFHQANPGILVYDPKGNLLSSWGDFPGAHGMTLAVEDGEEFLWLTDQETQKVVKTTLDGNEVLSLSHPPHSAYQEKSYIPTWVAVNEERHGGNGDIWVTDGYGCHLVHRFDRSGNYLSTIDGSEGTAGAFQCPHGIWIGPRKGKNLLYIADRGNKRIQVYDPEGRFVKSFGTEFLNSPDGFIAYQDQLIIPELAARVTIIDADDQLVGHIGENDGVNEKEGWPNNREHLLDDRFNSPHGAGVDAEGNLYITEWIIGGRVTKLEKR